MLVAKDFWHRMNGSNFSLQTLNSENDNFTFTWRGQFVGICLRAGTLNGVFHYVINKFNDSVLMNRSSNLFCLWGVLGINVKMIFVVDFTL